jgi:hypothetical protein
VFEVAGECVEVQVCEHNELALCAEIWVLQVFCSGSESRQDSSKERYGCLLVWGGRRSRIASTETGSKHLLTPKVKCSSGCIH